MALNSWSLTHAHVPYPPSGPARTELNPWLGPYLCWPSWWIEFQKRCILCLQTVYIFPVISVWKIKVNGGCIVQFFLPFLRGPKQIHIYTTWEILGIITVGWPQQTIAYTLVGTINKVGSIIVMLCSHLTSVFASTSTLLLQYNIASMVMQTQTQRMLTVFINVRIAIDTMLNFDCDANAGVNCEQAFSCRLLRTSANRSCLRTDKSINIQSVHGYPHTQQLKCSTWNDTILQ